MAVDFDPKPVNPARTPVLVLCGVLALMLLVAMTGGGSDKSSSTAASSTSQTTQTRSVAETATTKRESATPASQVVMGPFTSEPAMTSAISTNLGASNRGVPRVFFSELGKNGTYQVRFNINDNLLDGMIRAGARKDVLDIIRIVKSSGLPVKRLAVVGAYTMKDPYGNTANEVVISLVYSSATLTRINTEGVDWMMSNDLYAIADQRQVAPAFVSR